jgi:hypothetical protein
VLARVAQQDERQVRMQVEDLVQPYGLRLTAGRGAEQVAQQDRSPREVPVLEEGDQEREEVPGAGGDVEERVPADPVSVCLTIWPTRCTPVSRMVSSTSEITPNRASSGGTKTSNVVVCGSVSPR